MKRLLTISTAMLLAAAACAGQCTTIAGGPIPAAYLSGTNKCAIGGHAFGTSTTHCLGADGDEADFTVPLTVAAVGQGAWATWNSPPYAESALPWVGFTTTNDSVVIKLLKAASMAGMEIEPDAFATSGVSATFYDAGNNVLASVVQHLVGSSGSMLFAAMCPSASISMVLIRAAPSAGGFAIANLRADTLTGNADNEPVAPGPTLAAPGTTRNH